MISGTRRWLLDSLLLLPLQRKICHPQGDADVLSQHPAVVSSGHHQPDLVIEPDPKPLHERDVITGGQVTGIDELLYILH